MSENTKKEQTSWINIFFFHKIISKYLYTVSMLVWIIIQCYQVKCMYDFC